eukprot:6194780-Pleurochrysis_carterae.AAC.1
MYVQRWTSSDRTRAQNLRCVLPAVYMHTFASGTSVKHSSRLIQLSWILLYQRFFGMEDA